MDINDGLVERWFKAYQIQQLMIRLEQNLPIKYFQNRPKLSTKQSNGNAQPDDSFLSFHENSLMFVSYKQNDRQQSLLYVPAYVRTHFRNMTEMDIQNLSSRFIATMNIDFYIGKYSNEDEEKEARQFAEWLHQIFKKELKITFQNDFVVNMEDDLSSNVSDSDRLIRTELVTYKSGEVTRIYSNFQITREFKFGLHSDIFFFPLEQNILDLVTTLNSIKTKIQVPARGPDSNVTTWVPLTIRFNCMSLEITDKKKQHPPKQLERYFEENSMLIEHLRELYMIENKGEELDEPTLIKEFVENRNHPFFRDLKISFPLKKNATEFGYYQIIERDVMAYYTREKQIPTDQTCYERLKNCLFCRKEIQNIEQIDDYASMDGPSGKVFSQTRQEYQKLSHGDNTIQQSFCNVIMHIPLLKASLGTIIQLCIPIFFLSFITLVQFLYSASSSQDQIRGYKIGASTLIVATYISFIYAMRSVIPPTPSWSLFEMAVCLLAGSCIFPIIQVIYQSNINDTMNPFLKADGLFIASFCVNSGLCLMIVTILIIISIYKSIKIKRHRSIKVTMANLIESLTKKYFHLWRNYACKVEMEQILLGFIAKKSATVVYDH